LARPSPSPTRRRSSAHGTSAPRPPRRRPGRLAALAALCALLPLLAACAPFGPIGPTPPRRLDDAQQVLRPLLPGENGGDLDTLDPALIQFGDDYDLARAVFPPLVTTDAKLNLIPWAATALPEVSADGLAYTFHLRARMKWSDGVRIDAATYAYSINRALDRCTGEHDYGSPVWSYLAQIKGAVAFHKLACPAGAAGQPANVNLTDGPAHSVVVVDPTTLRLTLEAPAAYFLAEFTYPTSWAQPRQLIDRYGDKWTDHLADDGGFGGNLFKVTTWDHAGHFSLARNDAFWGTKPILRAIEWTLYKDGAALWSDFTSGTGDEAVPATADRAAARAMAGYREIHALAISYLFINWTTPPFDDARVRRAFDLAFDRRALCDQILNGVCLPTTHIVIEGLPGYNEGLKDPAGRTGGAALSADVADAQKLATAYRDERCGGDYAKCPPISLITQRGSAVQAAEGGFWLNAWEAAFPGWKITLSSPRCGQICFDGGYQIVTEGWGADYADPQDFTSLLLRSGASDNQGGVSIPAADALLDRADVEQDRATRLALYQRAEQFFVDRVAWIPWGQPKGVVVVRPRVVGWAYDSALTVPLPAWQSAYLHD